MEQIGYYAGKYGRSQWSKNSLSVRCIWNSCTNPPVSLRRGQSFPGYCHRPTRTHDRAAYETTAISWANHALHLKYVPIIPISSVSGKHQSANVFYKHQTSVPRSPFCFPYQECITTPSKRVCPFIFSKADFKLHSNTTLCQFNYRWMEKYQQIRKVRSSAFRRFASRPRSPPWQDGMPSVTALTFGRICPHKR